VNDDNRIGWLIGGMLVLLFATIAWSAWPRHHVAVTTPVIAAPVAVDGVTPVVVQQPTPVIVQHHDDSGFLNGLWMGHMLGGGSNTHTREVHHYNTPTTTVVHAPAAPARVYVAPAPVRQAPPVITTGYRSTGSTRSVTVSPAPSRSYSSPVRSTSVSTGFRSSGTTRSVSVSRGR